MRAEDFYKYLYSIFENVTPLKGDCGTLCGGACCSESDAGSGMYLYPMEHKIYTPRPDWVKIYKTDFEYGDNHPVYMLSCPDRCDREIRPLACRIFPLVPYVKRGEKLQIIIDPRSRGLCPLYESGVDGEFIAAVARAAKILYAEPECREYLYAQSQLIDDYIKFYKPEGL